MSEDNRRAVRVLGKTASFQDCESSAIIKLKTELEFCDKGGTAGAEAAVSGDRARF
jgi:hypothetical protein